MTKTPEYHWYFCFSEELETTTAQGYINEGKLFGNLEKKIYYYDIGKCAFTQTDCYKFTSLTINGTLGYGTRSNGETRGQLVRAPISDLSKVPNLNQLTWGKDKQ